MLLVAVSDSVFGKHCQVSAGMTGKYCDTITCKTVYCDTSMLSFHAKPEEVIQHYIVPL